MRLPAEGSPGAPNHLTFIGADTDTAIDCECAEARAEQIVADNAGGGEADGIGPVIAAPTRAHSETLSGQDDWLGQRRGSGNALGQLIVAGDEMVDLTLQAGEPACDFAR